MEVESLSPSSEFSEETARGRGASERRKRGRERATDTGDVTGTGDARDQKRRNVVGRIRQAFAESPDDATLRDEIRSQMPERLQDTGWLAATLGQKVMQHGQNIRDRSQQLAQLVATARELRQALDNVTFEKQTLEGQVRDLQDSIDREQGALTQELNDDVVIFNDILGELLQTFNTQIEQNVGALNDQINRLTETLTLSE